MQIKYANLFTWRVKDGEKRNGEDGGGEGKQKHQPLFPASAAPAVTPTDALDAGVDVGDAIGHHRFIIDVDGDVTVHLTAAAAAVIGDGALDSGGTLATLATPQQPLPPSRVFQVDRFDAFQTSGSLTSSRVYLARLAGVVGVVDVGGSRGDCERAHSASLRQLRPAAIPLAVSCVIRASTRPPPLVPPTATITHSGNVAAPLLLFTLLLLLLLATL